MSDDTQADIAAAKGKHCNASCSDYYCSQNVRGRCQATHKCLGPEEAAELVAELEAAKREIAALRKRELGDCAKLRESLSKFCAYSAVVLNTGMFNRVHLEALLNMAKAALAAPVRNCNMFQTKDAAREAFQKLRGHRVWADVSLWDDRDEIEAFLDWLFALAATEKEGGNDGNE